MCKDVNIGSGLQTSLRIPFLENHRVTVDVDCCILETSNEGLALRLEIDAAALCQSDLSPPSKSRCFILTDVISTVRLLIV